MDDKVQGIFGQNLADYFAHHKIQYKPLVYKGNEVDKEIASVEQILVDLKKNGISRYVINNKLTAFFLVIYDLL